MGNRVNGERYGQAGTPQVVSNGIGPAGGIPYPTLGPLVCDWIEDFLVHGPGDIQGTPIELDDEFRAFIWRCYEIYPVGHPLVGRRVFRRGILSRPKGRAKSELAGMIACAEALGEVRFDGWDAAGNPVGAPVTSAQVRCFATEAGQAGNTFDNCVYMMQNGDVYDEYPGIDPGITRINLPDGGSIISTTSSAGSKDGGKDTFSVFDETHLWTVPRLKDLHGTITRNLVKRYQADGWVLETSTMYCPGEDSVAEETHTAVRSGQLDGVLFDHRQADESVDITNDDELREALIHVYGAAAAWTNIDGIIADFHDPTKRESENRRYWLNQPWSIEEKFVRPAEYDACYLERERIPDHARVILGFDGSFSDDSTGIVAITLDGKPHLEVVDAWERPEGIASENWRVPRMEVMASIRAAAHRWQVVAAAADPAWWAQTLEELADEGIAVLEFPQSGARMIPATKRLYDLIMSQGITHDGDDRLRRHVINSVVKTDSRGFRLSKNKAHSAFKIDLAVAAVIAVGQASDYLEVEAPEVWDLNEIVERLRRERAGIPQDPNAEQDDSDDAPAAPPEPEPEGLGPSGVRFIPI